MPPSQETPLEKDIANTNLNLDISESVPSTAKKTPTSNDSLIVSKPPAGEDKGNEVRAPAPSSYIYSYSAPHIGNSKCSFLALPIEIRLQICDILLLGVIYEESHGKKE